MLIFTPHTPVRCWFVAEGVNSLHPFLWGFFAFPFSGRSGSFCNHCVPAADLVSAIGDKKQDTGLCSVPLTMCMGSTSLSCVLEPFWCLLGRKIPILLAPFKMTRKALHQPKAGCSFSSAEIQHLIRKTYYFLPKPIVLTSGVSMKTYADFSLLKYVYRAK